MLHVLLLAIASYISYISYASVDTSLGLEPEDCPRIRRSWNSMSHTDRDLYISGLLKLRENGEGNIEKDDFIAIASVHRQHWEKVADDFDVSAHGSSTYFFWHGYFVWELEGRIRSLGGKWKCFGMPYWDFSIESGRESNPFIYSTGLGGDGDPDNAYSVNGYSWKYDTSQYWVPFNCDAKDDKYPLCSLKRHVQSDLKIMSAEQIGAVIIENPEFREFSYALSRGTNTANFFKGFDTETLIVSYDPTWYLLHSMISLEQALWTDCNQYDLIDSSDLDNYPEAYTPYCQVAQMTSTCAGYLSESQLELDGVLIFNDQLRHKEWSYIHSNDLTIRKRYDMSRWNIIYDLDDGDGNSFYERSGLKKHCKRKLNPNWFIVNDVEAYYLNYDGIMALIINNKGYQYYIIIIILSMVASMVLYYYYYSQKNTISERKKLNNSDCNTPLLSV